MSTQEKPYLSEIIDYDRDIAPYQFIKIYAGVGSGKNYFVDHLVKGDVFRHADGSLVAKQNILLVTSRRAKADEQRALKHVIYDRGIGIFDDISTLYYFADDDVCQEVESSPQKELPDYGGGFMGKEIRLRSCACTNAQIEYAWKEYLPAEAITHPWERFDMIVIDEVHALLSDATYQSAPFYVRRLIEETLARSENCKVLVMTGSPQIFEDYPLLEKAHTIDVMDCCRSVTPEEVVFVTAKQAIAIMCNLLNQDMKAVYFANRIRRVKELFSIARKHTKSHVIMSFSDQAKRTSLKHDDIDAYNTMVDAEELLRKEQRLPEKCMAFISTARNKEGINIKNSDIKYMFVEAYADIDVQQMAGRLRNGMERLFVVIDAPDVTVQEEEEEVLFSQDDNLKNAVQSYLEKLCKEVGFEDYENNRHKNVLHYDRLASYVSFVHDKFPYLKYDFATKKFVFYKEREIGRAYYAKQEAIFSSALSQQGLKELAAVWYPSTRCDVRVPFQNEHEKKIAAYLEQSGWLEVGVKIKDAEREIILKEVNKITGIEWKRLGAALQHYGYELEMKSKKKDCLSRIRRI